MDDNAYEAVGVIKSGHLFKPPPAPPPPTPAPIKKPNAIGAKKKNAKAGKKGVQTKEKPKKRPAIQQPTPLEPSSGDVKKPFEPSSGDANNKPPEDIEQLVSEQVTLDQGKENADITYTPSEMIQSTSVKHRSGISDDEGPTVLHVCAKTSLILCAFLFFIGLLLIVGSSVGLHLDW